MSLTNTDRRGPCASEPTGQWSTRPSRARDERNRQLRFDPQRAEARGRDAGAAPVGRRGCACRRSRGGRGLARHATPRSLQAGRRRGRGAVAPVPVGVAQAGEGDLPVYLTGLGTVTAYTTVTVKSRGDGPSVLVAFTVGQDMKKGDLLAVVDPLPFEVQLNQAKASLA